VSRLSRQCGILNISQPYRPPQPVTPVSKKHFFQLDTALPLNPNAMLDVCNEHFGNNVVYNHFPGWFWYGGRVYPGHHTVQTLTRMISSCGFF
jgi:hypothetical protein